MINSLQKLDLNSPVYDIYLIGYSIETISSKAKSAYGLKFETGVKSAILMERTEYVIKPDHYELFAYKVLIDLLSKPEINPKAEINIYGKLAFEYLENLCFEYTYTAEKELASEVYFGLTTLARKLPNLNLINVEKYDENLKKDLNRALTENFLINDFDVRNKFIIPAGDNSTLEFLWEKLSKDNPFNQIVMYAHYEAETSMVIPLRVFTQEELGSLNDFMRGLDNPIEKFPAGNSLKNNFIRVLGMITRDTEFGVILDRFINIEDAKPSSIWLMRAYDELDKPYVLCNPMMDYFYLISRGKKEIVNIKKTNMFSIGTNIGIHINKDAMRFNHQKFSQFLKLFR